MLRIKKNIYICVTVNSERCPTRVQDEEPRHDLLSQQQAVGQLAEPVRSVADRAAVKRKHGVHREANRRSVGTEPQRVAYLAASMYTWVVLSAWLELLLRLQQTSCRVKPKASR